jgi:thiamine-monophosphate kinase
MESELIAYLRERLPPHPSLRLGAGDDAAILSLGESSDAVVTVDMLMDGVDFRLDEVAPRRVGRKSLAVNLSDLAAMAAEPVAAVVALALPKQGGMALAKSLYEGILPLAAEFDVAIAGGDTNSWDGPLVISITAIGSVKAIKTANSTSTAWRRSGARPGDLLLATGEFGGSILGKHFDFTPRLREARILAERYEIHAAIDVSDGLAIDASRLAAESRCGVCLNLASIPIAPAAAELARQSPHDESPLDHALGDGEDFELLLAVDPETAARMLAEQPLSIPLTAIGEFLSEPGLWQRAEAGNITPLEPRGYLHHFE